jgi:methionine synthase II (cobalamin-independent)
MKISDNRILTTHVGSLPRSKAVTEGLMNAASPGVIALFQPNHHYPDHECYLEALANAMQTETQPTNQPS